MRPGKVTMFVNVSNTASAFDETLHVLRFSALTGKVSRVHMIASSAYSWLPRCLVGEGIGWFRPIFFMQCFVFS